MHSNFSWNPQVLSCYLLTERRILPALTPTPVFLFELPEYLQARSPSDFDYLIRDLEATTNYL